ncbi:MAG: hypothetical protein ACK5LV_08090 [Lachnospirales bacterium]
MNDDLQDLTLEEIENTYEENLEVLENIKLNYQYSEEDNLYLGGAKTRFKANVEATYLDTYQFSWDMRVQLYN